RALRPVAPDLLVCAPLGPGDDRRSVGGERLHVVGRSPEQRAADEEGAQAPNADADPILDALRAADPEGIAELPTAAAPRLGGVAVREVVRLRRRQAPVAPRAVRALCPEADGAGALPVHTDEIERGRRLQDHTAARGQ